MTQRLRIAIVAASYPNSEDSVSGIFVRDQAGILAEWNDVVVVAPRVVVLSRRPSAWPAVIAGIRSLGQAVGAGDGSISTARPIAWSVPRASGLTERLYERAIERGARRASGWRRPDVIHAHVVLPAGLAAVRLGRSLGVPVVLTEHSSPFSAHLATAESRRAVEEALRGASRVIAVGEGLRDEILGVASVPVDVVGNAVAPTFFAEPLHAVRPLRRGRSVRLLAIGFLTGQKRFDLLLDAVASVPIARCRLELVIVGEGPDSGALRARASNLGLADRVRFVPLVPRSELIQWLAWCDALVSSSDHESFGLVIAEALATGLPVVATASGGPERFVDPEIGRLVPRGDAHTLAGSLMTLPEFLVNFRPEVARRRMAERFGPDVFAERMMAIYAEVACLLADGIAPGPTGREGVGP